MWQNINFVQAVTSGVTWMVPMTKIMAALRDFPGELGDALREAASPPSPEGIRLTADLAQDQIDSKFGFLHALSLMAAWGAFEAFIDDLCVARLTMNPGLLATDPLSKVKVTAALLGIDHAESLQTVIETAIAQQKAPLRSGQGAVESKLALVGLAGAVPKALGDRVFLAQKVRNVWAHRGGVADKRFVEQCSTLMPVEVGDHIIIDHQEFETHMNTLLEYVVIIVNRHRAEIGLPTVPWAVAEPGWTSAAARESLRNSSTPDNI